MKLVAGLGNPGQRYARTRHNVGFAAADLLAARWRLRWRRGRCDSLVCKREFSAGPVVLAKPQTFMNHSGAALACLLRSLALDARDLVTLHDDLDLPLGRVRVKLGGGSGGHRGVESAIEEIGSSEFIRVRIGIGRPREGLDPSRYVLEKFCGEQLEVVHAAIVTAAEAVESLLTEGLVRTLNAFNSRS